MTNYYDIVGDLLDRVAAEKLQADLLGIDRSVRRYHRLVRGLEPWPTFVAPELTTTNIVGCGQGVRRAEERFIGPDANLPGAVSGPLAPRSKAVNVSKQAA
jgi:hypothetical protein